MSVVIPTHNRADLLARAIESARSQEGVAVEVIVSDDGSTDGTPEVVRRFPGVVTRRREAAGGASAARNAGLAAAGAPLVAFLDDDDYWLPGKLRADAARLAAEPGAVACYGPVRATGPDGFRLDHPRYLDLPEGDILFRVLARAAPCVPSVLTVRRAEALAVGGFDEGLRISEDRDFFARLAERGRFVVSPETLTIIDYTHPYPHLGFSGIAAGWRDGTVVRRRWAGRYRFDPRFRRRLWAAKALHAADTRAWIERELARGDLALGERRRLARERLLRIVAAKACRALARPGSLPPPAYRASLPPSIPAGPVTPFPRH